MLAADWLDGLKMLLAARCQISCCHKKAQGSGLRSWIWGGQSGTISAWLIASDVPLAFYAIAQGAPLSGLPRA